MICKSCGRANELGARFCKSCGAPLESDESMQQNNTYQSENVYQQNNQYVMPESLYSGTTRMTKKEFNECANIKSITKNITAAAIIAYVIGAITFIVNVVMAGNIAGLVDVMIVVGLGLGIHLAKSRACAVIITAYSIFNFIFELLFKISEDVIFIPFTPPFMDFDRVPDCASFCFICLSILNNVIPPAGKDPLSSLI